MNPKHLEILKREVGEWNAWRLANPTVEPDLTGVRLEDEILNGADLAGAVLSGSSFFNCDLIGVNLDKACLCEVQFLGCDLSAASLAGAEFITSSVIKAKFLRADLSGTSLELDQFLKVDFTGADFSRTRLSATGFVDTTFNGAVFNGTFLREVVLANCDLSGSLGLDSVQHQGPSSIGIDTIFRSQGRLPEVFLRGTGVPEVFIRFAASL